MSFVLNNSYYQNQSCVFDYSAEKIHNGNRCEETSVNWYSVYTEQMVGNTCHVEIDYVPLAHFSTEKVGDVLTEETRYVLTQEEQDYFTEKYDIDNMDAFEMDCMLYEMEQMGVLTQSERLAMHPFIDCNGCPRGQSNAFVEGESFSYPMVCMSRVDYEGVYDPYKENTFSAFSEMISDLKQKIYEAYALGENVSSLEEQLKQADFVIDYLLALFQRDEEGQSTASLEEETGLQRQLSRDLGQEQLLRDFRALMA